MFASNKTLSSFDRPQKPFGLVGVNRVLNVLLMGDKFQIVQSIVAAIKVFVIYFQSALNPTVKRFPHHSMHTASDVFALFTQAGNPISFKQLNFCWPVSCVTCPSFTLLDRMRCSYASAQKLSNLLKGSAALKHLFCLGNFSCIKRFASGNSAHSAVIADLVQIFKAKNWFPRFHAQLPFNINRSIA